MCGPRRSAPQASLRSGSIRRDGSHSDEEFTDKLDELITTGRDGSLSDEDMIVLLDRATKALREGLS